LNSGDGPAVTYYVANAYSAKVLDDPHSSTSNGTGMDQWQLNGGANQEWTFVPISNGSDLIVNASSGLVLDDPGGSTSANTQMDQWQLDGGSNQWWNVISLSDVDFELVNAESGQALTDYDYSTNNGTPIVQWPWYGGVSQQWDLLQPLIFNGNPGYSRTTSPKITGNPSANETTSVLDDSGRFAGNGFAVIANPTSFSGVASDTNVGTAKGIGLSVGVTVQPGTRMDAPAIGGLAGAGALSPSRYGTLIGQGSRPAQGLSSDRAALDAAFADYDPTEYRLISSFRRRGRVLGGPASTGG
jgi:hypothetical protein